jgi:hypothetical protein
LNGRFKNARIALMQTMEPANGNKESKLIGTGEGEVPLARVPFQKIEMRTMNSDMSSIAQNGGGSPTPYVPGNTSPAAAPQSAPMQQNSSFNIADISSPQGAPQVQTTPGMTGGSVPQGNGGNKNLFIWLMIGLAVLIVAAAAYFFLLPALKNMNADVALEEQQKAAENVVPEVTPEVPAVENPETVDVHASFLKSPADLTSEIRPELFTIAGIKSAIQPTSTTVPLFKELVVKTGDNKTLSFAGFTGIFFPTFFTPQQTINFENDFTFVSYTNKAGTWLGFAAKLKDSSDIAFVQSQLNGFQAEPTIKDFYLSSPGNQLNWKDGKVANRAASVLEFSTRGTEFVYVWFDRYLIVSTSLEGAAETAKRIGF